MNWKAARTSAALSILFLIVYGNCNLITAHRHYVGSIYFPFERHIPFVPLMIVPYLSIDFFFITAPFFCRDDHQRRLLARRIVLEILIAAGCFLLFPLRFAFVRPAVSGTLGMAFDIFRAMDLPFNQLPSLHVAQLMVFAPIFVNRVPRALKIPLWIWFALIVLSTVFTYQHHIMDVAGGFALAAVGFYLVPDSPPIRERLMRNQRVGFYYLCGAIAVTITAILLRPIGLLLLWPAASLLLATVGYWSQGAAIFHKQNGKLPLATRIMLWPILLGQHLSLLYYRRQCSAWDRLTDRVWIGRKLNTAKARQAIAAGVTAVLDLTGEFSEAAPFLSLKYLQIPILDLTAPSPGQIDQAIEFIAAAERAGKVYIHCKIGYSRTAAIAGAYLISSGQADTPGQAIAMLRAVRPSIIIRPEALAVIQADRTRRLEPMLERFVTDRSGLST